MMMGGGVWITVLVSLVLMAVFVPVGMCREDSSTEHNTHRPISSPVEAPRAPHAQEDSEREVALRGYDRPSEVFPRRKLNGDKVPRRLAGCPDDAEDFDDCDSTGYAESLALICVVPFVMAVLCLLVGLIFIIARFCCNCCGGLKATPGCMCPTAGVKFKGYTTGQIWAVKIGMIVVTVGIVVCMSVGYANNKDLSTGVKDFRDVLIDTGELVYDRTKTLRDALADLPYTDEPEQIEEFDEMLTEARDILDTVHDINDDVDTVMDWREAGLNITYIVPMVMCAMAAIGAFFNLRWLTIFMLILGWLVLPIMWLAFALHLPLELVLGDLCYELDRSTEDDTTPLGPALDHVLKCDNGSLFHDAKREAEKGLQEADDIACDTLAEFLDLSQTTPQRDRHGTEFFVFNSPSGECNSETIPTFPDEITVKDFEYCCYDGGTEVCHSLDTCTTIRAKIVAERSLVECTTDCLDTLVRQGPDYSTPGTEGYKPLAVSLEENARLYVEYRDIIRDQVLPLFDCAFIRDAFDDMSVALCDTTGDALSAIAATLCCVAVLLIPGLVFSILGFKRFNSSNSASLIARKEQTGAVLEPPAAGQPMEYQLVQTSASGAFPALPPGTNVYQAPPPGDMYQVPPPGSVYQVPPPDDVYKASPPEFDSGYAFAAPPPPALTGDDKFFPDGEEQVPPPPPYGSESHSEIGP